MKRFHHLIYSKDGPWEPRLDDGFPEYLYVIYRYMTAGLVFSGSVAYLCTRSPLYSDLARLPRVALPTLLLPIIYVVVMSRRIDRVNPRHAAGYFWLFALLIGFSFAGINQIYWGEGIAHAFFETAGAFLLVSVMGFFSKRSMTPVGTFIMLALVGIGLAVFVNRWQPVGDLPLFTTILGIVVFATLTACNTSTLKLRFYRMRMADDIYDPNPSVGALNLYLDYLNLFLSLWRLTPKHFFHHSSHPD